MPATVMKKMAKKMKNMPHVQLTSSEQVRIDTVLRARGGSPADAVLAINAVRLKQKIRIINKSAVYRYASGLSHKRGKLEARGRKPLLSKRDKRSLETARRRLIKNAKNAKRVTYADVVKEADLAGDPCDRICADALRAEGVSWRAPRRKIFVTEGDAALRWDVAKVWGKRPESYWTDDVKAFVDNKNFPIPLTPKQRKRFAQTLVTGHLRKAGEGTDRHFTKPREKHSFIGIPSVTISAAVANNRIIMWHVVPGKWNGEAAANMYENHLKPALVRAWGKRPRYTIIEDGDRKGNTSGKGIAAKARAKIYATTLPPRTPSLMPLDYAIWTEIIKRLVKSAPRGTESKVDFLARLLKIAMGLPKGYVKRVIKKMKVNAQALDAAKGFTPKND